MDIMRSTNCVHELDSVCVLNTHSYAVYRVADKSLPRPTSRCILFDGENISFDASLVIYKLN
jgi:hypothetical protein